MKLRWKKGLAGEQRGAFIVFTALAVWFLMMFVAFAVDFGNYYQHRSRLQNAADAAALAGIAKYADSDEFANSATAPNKGRLVKIPTDVTLGQDGKAASFSDDSYTFTKIEDVPDAVHTQGAAYVHKNYRDSMDIKEDSMWTAVQNSTSSTTTGGTAQTTTMTKKYCYRVDLEDTVSTFFARIFHPDLATLTVKVSAMAMLDGTESFTTEEVVEAITLNINDVIPNYYSETIREQQGIIRDENGTEIGKTVLYGPKSEKFYTYLDQVKDAGLTAGVNMERRFDSTGQQIIGYQEPTNAKNIGICAEPIYAIETPADDEVWALVYDFTNGYITPEGKEIIGLFLDRDRISENAGKTVLKDVGSSNLGEIEYKSGTWFGSRERFTEIKIGELTVNPNQPIYARIESEPVYMGRHELDLDTNNNNLTTVHAVDVYANTPDREVLKGCVKPFVLAYDGPDMNRDEYAAPSIAIETIPTSEIKFYSLKNPIRPGQIQSDIEPVHKKIRKYLKDHPNETEDTVRIPDTLVQTAITTPGPFTVHIPRECVFYGIIFAPRSRVIIDGPGRIVGCIAAREIVIVNGSYGFRTSQPITVPVLSATRRSNGVFDYTRRVVTDTYNIAYSGTRPDLSFLQNPL
ncbi:MAG: Tad domain-containing protein [Schwartzia sp.]|nr:Tad domain-containing protein [Schwartzia sp. (in: firmicutes)]